MDEQTTAQPDARSVPDMAVYEQLYSKLNAYRFGVIGFLELLDAFEEILGIKTSSDQRDGA